jgi:hypothetical protein
MNAIVASELHIRFGTFTLCKWDNMDMTYITVRVAYDNIML